MATEDGRTFSTFVFLRRPSALSKEAERESRPPLKVAKSALKVIALKALLGTVFLVFPEMVRSTVLALSLTLIFLGAAFFLGGMTALFTGSFLPDLPVCNGLDMGSPYK